MRQDCTCNTPNGIFALTDVCSTATVQRSGGSNLLAEPELVAIGLRSPAATACDGKQAVQNAVNCLAPSSLGDWWGGGAGATAPGAGVSPAMGDLGARPPAEEARARAGRDALGSLGLAALLIRFPALPDFEVDPSPPQRKPGHLR